MTVIAGLEALPNVKMPHKGRDSETTALAKQANQFRQFDSKCWSSHLPGQHPIFVHASPCLQQGERNSACNTVWFGWVLVFYRVGAFICVFERDLADPGSS